MSRSQSERPVWNILVVSGLVLLALPFVVYAIDKGLKLPLQSERASSRFFDPQAAFASAALYGHMVSGGLITFLAPFQMLGIVRSRWPVLHHVCGYLVAGLSLLTATAGLFYIACQGTIGGPVMSAGFALYGGLMVAAACQTLRTARRRRPDHSLWAGRLIILALASWLYRVHYGIWEVATGGIGTRSDFSGSFDVIQVFAFYTPYLVLHHIWWHRKQRRG